MVVTAQVLTDQGRAREDVQQVRRRSTTFHLFSLLIYLIPLFYYLFVLLFSRISPLFYLLPLLSNYIALLSLLFLSHPSTLLSYPSLLLSNISFSILSLFSPILLFHLISPLILHSLLFKFPPLLSQCSFFSTSNTHLMNLITYPPSFSALFPHTLFYSVYFNSSFSSFLSLSLSLSLFFFFFFFFLSTGLKG